MIRKYFIYVLLGLLTACTATEVKETSDVHSFSNFISVDGYHIMDGLDTVRFVSWNIPNLNYVEDEMKFESNNPYALPTEYEIRDALMTIKEMGGQVVRMYTIPVRSKMLPAEAVTYVEAPGKFNEEAFQNLDLVLSLANELGIRVIVPFINNWQWFGGVPNYADFRNKTYDEFWSDEQLWDDFILTVDHVLNRVNTITGVKYIDDKAIFCWESGNELQNPYSWVSKLAEHVKSIDTNHVFMDGYHAVDDTPFYPEVFTDENIDIISSHHYEVDPLDMLHNIKTKVDTIAGRKAYFVGEFGFVSTTGLDMVLDYILEEERIFGAMSWSIRHHHRDGGFYWHSEPAGLDLYKAFHWPGFENGNDYDEANLLGIFRDAAFTIQDKETPEVSIPEPPHLLAITDGEAIRWQGSMGARYYEIYRSEKNTDSWIKIDAYAAENDRPYFAGFVDESSQIGMSYDYKIKAVNESGSSDYSNIESVDSITHKLFIDHPSNSARCLSAKNIVFEKGNDREYKEMLSRMRGELGSEVIYRVEGDIESIIVYGFSDSKEPKLRFSTSVDGTVYDNNVPFDFYEYSVGEKLYNYKIPVKYIIESNKENDALIKIEFDEVTYIGRIEIKYK